MKNFILFVLICALCPFLVGCTTHITDISVVSNKQVELRRVNINRASQHKNVVGQDTKFVFLFIPLGTPTIQQALNDALEKGNGDLMIDASLYYKGWWFLVGQNTIEIKGTVVNTRGAK